MTSRVEPSRALRAAQRRAAPPRLGGALTESGSAAGQPVSSRRSLAGALLGLLALTGCGPVEKYPMTVFEPMSDYAIMIDELQDLSIVLGVGVGILVFVLLAYILVKFRYRPDSPQPKQVHGNTTLELAWTLIPAVLIAIIAVPTVRTIFATQAEAPPNALTIDVVGYQWWFEFRYPMGNDTVVTANEIHVPVGRPVELRLHSADVLHSFWVPQMGGKRDLIPNRVNRIVFTPLEPGVYLGQCAEFCGDSHALMYMRLIAHTPEEFQRWLAHEAKPAVEPTDSAVMIGKQLVTGGACAGCHIIEGTNAQFGRSGPNLTHFARRTTLAAGVLENNAQNLHRWIKNPQAIKPGALMPNLGLSDQEISYMVAYLQTLY